MKKPPQPNLVPWVPYTPHIAYYELKVGLITIVMMAIIIITGLFAERFI